MPEREDSAAKWHKSLASGTGNCVEVQQTATTVQVRDSKDPGGPHLTFTHQEWEAFLTGVRLGEFNVKDHTL